MSQTAAPPRSFLQKIDWHWESQKQTSFQKIKQAVAEAATLKYFHPKKLVKVSVDASSKGMGAVLLREECPIAYASKALTSSQQNYAQIEKEMLQLCSEAPGSMNTYSECQK